MDGSVVVLYVNDDIAFSNRIYNVYGKNWGLYGEYGEVSFEQVQAEYTD